MTVSCAFGMIWDDQIALCDNNKGYCWTCWMWNLQGLSYTIYFIYFRLTRLKMCYLIWKSLISCCLHDSEEMWYSGCCKFTYWILGKIRSFEHKKCLKTFLYHCFSYQFWICLNIVWVSTFSTYLCNLFD